MIYTYRNTKTGVTITVPCEVSGKYWELVKTKETPAEKPSAGKPKTSRKKG